MAYRLTISIRIIFFNFPAASIGWMITEEDFLKDNEVVSLLKLKTGFGITGNAEIPNYAQWGAVSVNTNQLYVGDNYWYINSLKNPDLKWETTNRSRREITKFIILPKS